MTAYLIVRAEVSEADREAFDHWYETEHLPDAKRAFATLSARRGWSDVTPGVHIALYEFPDLAAARAATSGDAIKALIAEFDRVWQSRVVRTREVVGIKQVL
ncbi:MAG: hypothetical protein KDC18_10775 [Alphaproteobacteria bacterium]|nr:hypothetical protein [Alphaproteobacteria bacterium]MCB9931223.1 hypothetical protein [Alphaproteobacteria bacterium]